MLCRPIFLIYKDDPKDKCQSLVRHRVTHQYLQLLPGSLRKAAGRLTPHACEAWEAVKSPSPAVKEAYVPGTHTHAHTPTCTHMHTALGVLLECQPPLSPFSS